MQVCHNIDTPNLSRTESVSSQGDLQACSTMQRKLVQRIKYFDYPLKFDEMDCRSECQIWTSPFTMATASLDDSAQLSRILARRDAVQPYGYLQQVPMLGRIAISLWLAEYLS